MLVSKKYVDQKVSSSGNVPSTIESQKGYILTAKFDPVNKQSSYAWELPEIGYTQATINAKLDSKANVGNVYTKAEVDANMLKKANVVDLAEKANLKSPVFSGTPKAPTLASTSHDDNIATTKFVTNAIANLIDGAPQSLDTLK